jgi:hypothetical protein
MNMTLKTETTIAKIHKRNFYQTKRLLHSKGNNHHSEETRYGMGENIFKLF